MRRGIVLRRTGSRPGLACRIEAGRRRRRDSRHRRVRPRMDRSRRLVDSGFRLATLIHPSAAVAADAIVGDGTVIAACAVVNAAAKLGIAAIVNSAAVAEHDCIVGNGCIISPGARLAGGVRIGNEAWIGIGATILERISIGNGAVIGAAPSCCATCRRTRSLTACRQELSARCLNDSAARNPHSDQPDRALLHDGALLCGVAAIERRPARR